MNTYQDMCILSTQTSEEMSFSFICLALVKNLIDNFFKNSS